MNALVKLLLLTFWLGSATSFVLLPVPGSTRSTTKTIVSQETVFCELRASPSNGGGIASETEGQPALLIVDRRSMLSITGTVLPAAIFGASILLEQPQMASSADGKAKFVVMGGAGYVGSRVSVALAEAGYDVVSVSRSSPSEQAAKVKANVGKTVSTIQYVSLDATIDDLVDVMKGAAAVISCVGIPPWEKKTARAGNGIANTRIAEAAKAAGVDRYVYVSVAKEFANSPAKFLFGEFFTGKAEAEAAAVRNFDNNHLVLVMPGLIEGAPPGEIRPPGPPGLAAISPDAVAKAAVAGALGQLTGSSSVIDGYDAIMAVAAK
jgi:uncharacterized protein YbjT (DUF2867 family)